jgi:transposase
MEAYSALNPIEQVFAKIKHWMRIAQKRTIDDACDHIGHLVRSVMSDECSNYFLNVPWRTWMTPRALSMSSIRSPATSEALSPAA